MAGSNAYIPHPEVDFVFKDWLKFLQKFYDDVEKTLEDIRKDKLEVQEMKKEIYNRINKGYYVYDKDCIVISAPEIIIGNVDKSGQLKPGKSKVTIRSSDVSIEGVGESGIVQTKATTIRQIAQDPGVDGFEAVVYDNACISSLARSIVIDSNNAKDVYTRSAIQRKTESGVTIHSDQELIIDASVSRNEQTEGISQMIANLKDEIQTMECETALCLEQMYTQVEQMETILSQDEKLCATEELTKANVTALDTLNLLLTDKSKAYFNTINSFLASVSNLAEKIRQKKILEDAKMSVSQEDFDKSPTGAMLQINGENVIINNHDGDSKMRTNPEANITLLSQNVNIKSTSKSGDTLKDGRVTIWGENVEVYTNNLKPGEKEGELDFPASGIFSVNSKNIRLMSYDLQGKDDDSMQIKNLTENGIVQINSQNIDIKSVDQEGKAVGMTSIIGKELNISSVDFEKDTWKEGKVAQQGCIRMKSETLHIGSQEQETKSLGLYSDKLYGAGDTRIDWVQKDGYVSLVEKTLKLNLPTMEVFGKDFKVHSAAAFSKDAEIMGSLSAKKVSIKDALEAPNINASSPMPTPKSTQGDTAISNEKGKANEAKKSKASDDDKQKQESDKLINNFTNAVKALSDLNLGKKKV